MIMGLIEQRNMLVSSFRVFSVMIKKKFIYANVNISRFNLALAICNAQFPGGESVD